MTMQRYAKSQGWVSYIPEYDCPECRKRVARDTLTNECSFCGCHRPGKVEVVRAAPSSAVLRDKRTATARFIDDDPYRLIDACDAKKLGLTQFRTGDPCPVGHMGWTYVVSRRCVDCVRLVPAPAA